MKLVHTISLLVFSSFASYTLALGTNDRAVCECYPDPHFRTWNDVYYSYHGEADLILCEGQVIDVHIKTQIFGNSNTVSRVTGFGGWSGVIAAAVHFHATDDTLEVRANGEFFVNGVQQTTTPSTIGGYAFSISTTQYQETMYQVDMGGNQFIQMFETYGPSLRVVMNLHGSVGYSCEGMCGNWKEDGILDRAGNTLMNTTYDPEAAKEVGEEWTVQGNDPTYFLVSHVGPPLYGQIIIIEELRQQAQAACGKGNATRNEAVFDQCVNDILITGDVEWADQPKYQEPEFQPDDTESECSRTPFLCRLLGGTCKWRCDRSEYWCFPRLCRESSNSDPVGIPGASFVEGCSCAFRRRR